MPMKPQLKASQAALTTRTDWFAVWRKTAEESGLSQNYRKYWDNASKEGNRASTLFSRVQDEDWHRPAKRFLCRGSIHLELTSRWRPTVLICHQLLSDTWKFISSHASGGFKGGRWGRPPLAHILFKKPLFSFKRHIFRCAHLRETEDAACKLFTAPLLFKIFGSATAPPHISDNVYRQIFHDHYWSLLL